jgi:hypothetical protein
MFYKSYQISSWETLGSHIAFAGGRFLVILSILFVLSKIYWKKTSPNYSIEFAIIWSYILLSFIYWTFIQSQPGIIHSIHTFVLLLPLGMASTIANQSFEKIKIVATSLLVITATTVSLIPIRGTIEEIRSHLTKFKPYGPDTFLPYVEKNLGDIQTIYREIEEFQRDAEPVLIPIGSSTMNVDLLKQYAIQRNLKPIKHLIEVPQVDLRDSNPFPFSYITQKHVVLLSKKWNSDLADGRNNLKALNEFYSLPQLKPFILRDKKVAIRNKEELFDSRLIEISVPKKWIIENAELIQQITTGNETISFSSDLRILYANTSQVWGPASSNIENFDINLNPEMEYIFIVNKDNLSKLTLENMNRCSKLIYKVNNFAQEYGVFDEVIIKFGRNANSLFLIRNNGENLCNLRIRK